ncbi:MAG: GNAT family N-acetyltransferase [Bacteroidetes bacterium GWF2_49_14]|nr:MAG: GNAT family N-acetyltransferase [Bacteroidetes bacterium GWF2_49_14]HBB91222.1 GNAT family N-acetyltransferase [Bacteroidales bacterium]
MIEIRKADASDAAVIAAFQLAMALETENLVLDAVTVHRGVHAVFDDEGKGFYLVAVDSERIVASLMITFEWSDWRNRTVWWIQSLYVIPEMRRKGIYRQMYAWLRQQVDSNDSIGGIRLYVDKSNLPAQKVYEELGMDGEHYRFYEDMKK